MRATARLFGDEDDFSRQMSCCLHGTARAHETQAVCELVSSAAKVIARLAGPGSDLGGSAIEADVDTNDVDECGSASCAPEGTGVLVVDVAARADDEGLHEEEGS